jgi:3-methyladenine DNA glycosylase AlkD
MPSSTTRRLRCKDLIADLRAASAPARAKTSAWFFKTGPGQYGEGDVFVGITVPVQRRIARMYRDLPLEELPELIASPVHEHRFTALEILVMKYERGDEQIKKAIVSFYLKHRRYINNWDLVDTSAPYILGDWLFARDKKVLHRFARSRNVWERRIAIISTLGFISRGRFDDTLAIAALLLSDTHDLIHKAAGWMLREVGKRSRETEEKFLKKHYKTMPRTMLRYALEHFPASKRTAYLKGRV